MVSVIIPALNEESSLEATLASVEDAEGSSEIIVADGGSHDATRAIAARYGRVVTTPPGRALQMNSGVCEARGDILLFLHADVVFPPTGLFSVKRALADCRVLGGNFGIVYEGTSLTCRVFTLINRWRRPLGIFYGDSGIFVRREVFDSLGGYRLLPLMEDYDFARRLVKRGRTICLKDPLVVSARRWEEYGLLRTLAAWVILHFFYYLRVPVRFWERLYPPIRREQPSRHPVLPSSEIESAR